VVCDAGLLEFMHEPRQHAISLFVENTDGRFSLFINDSEGGSYTGYQKEYIQPLCPKKVTLELCVSQVQRQKRGEPTCNVFAIEDCVAFQMDPNLMEKIRIGKGNSLPPVMMTFAQENGHAAIEKAIEHQLLVMNADPTGNDACRPTSLPVAESSFRDHKMVFSRLCTIS
jgi:hypothetical protein